MRGRPRLPPNGPRQKTPPLSEKFRKASPALFRKIPGRGPLPLPNFRENETPPTDGLGGKRQFGADVRAKDVQAEAVGSEGWCGVRDGGWNKSGTWKMLPCKKRRTTLTESPQHQGNQEEDDLDLQSAVKPESDQVKDLGSVSLSWSPSPGRAADLEVQDAGIQLGMEDPSLSSRMLTEDTNVAVLEAVDVAISQGLTLPSLESSQPVNTHLGKGKLQATSSRRGKKITLRPGSATQEDRGHHPIAKEPFSEEPSEEVKEEGVVNGIAGPKVEFFDTLLETSLLTPFSRIGQQTVNLSHKIIEDFPGGPVVKNPLTNTGDMGSVPEKYMNELMEESFETFQDEMGFSSVEDDGPEQEEHVAEPRPNFNTSRALWFEEPLANLLNEQHRTVKELLEQLKMKKSSAKQQQEVERVKPQREKVHQTLILDPAQRKRLQQQMQQKELGTFAQSSIAFHHQFNPKFQTLFQPCNLMGAMKLTEGFSTRVSIDWSPRKTVTKAAYRLPYLPKQVAWILATSKVFMYPELLLVCSLKAKNPQDKNFFTKAEDRSVSLVQISLQSSRLVKSTVSRSS
ncbi:hypothetical protein MG293_001221 [Ovis ammon polii]|uniref:Uncharacterized protein n=1 Tax=Ovis ammon polii TaxID=230172 RepID=A0AAD4YJ14_OVIAM|nr:hypothetical protein MG293_001221 [Ovis ammon polii]KAI4579553.1 hypothetical protein MJT46_000921 [Ovis ammon polii x Ovis aries]